MLEQYSSSHSETVEELGNWPAVRFELAWQAYAVRQALDRLDSERLTLIAAITANGNLDAESREKALNQFNEEFREKKWRIIDLERKTSQAEQLGIVDGNDDIDAVVSDNEELITDKWW